MFFYHTLEEVLVAQANARHLPPIPTLEQHNELLAKMERAIRRSHPRSCIKPKRKPDRTHEQYRRLEFMAALTQARVRQLVRTHEA